MNSASHLLFCLCLLLAFVTRFKVGENMMSMVPELKRRSMDLDRRASSAF